MLKDGRLAGRCRLAGRLKCVSHSHSANPHLTTQLIIKPWVLQEPGRMLALAGSSGSSRLAVAAHRGHAASSSRAALQLGSHCRASGVCSTPRRSRQAVAPRAAGQEDTSTSAAPSVPSAGPAKTGRSRGPAAVNDSVPEQLFYEGGASNAELLISLLLAATLVYIPITIAVIGKKLWFTFRFTNKRLTIINKSPLFAKTIEVAYSNIAEIRTAPRAFGLWGDAVVFLKDGSRLELTGLERYADIKRHIESCIYDDA